MSASLYGINVDLAIVNKIMPNTTVSKDSNEYFKKLTEFQHSMLEEAKANFYPLSIKEVPLHSGELAGLEMLRANANLMFREGKLIYIIKENRFPSFNKMQIDYTSRLKFPLRKRRTSILRDSVRK